MRIIGSSSIFTTLLYENSNCNVKRKVHGTKLIHLLVYVAKHNYKYKFTSIGVGSRGPKFGNHMKAKRLATYAL